MEAYKQQDHDYDEAMERDAIIEDMQDKFEKELSAVTADRDALKKEIRALKSENSDLRKLIDCLAGGARTHNTC